MAFSYKEQTYGSVTLRSSRYFDITYTTLDYTPLHSTTQLEADKYVSDVGDTLKVTVGVTELDRTASGNSTLWVVEPGNNRVSIDTQHSAFTALSVTNDTLIRLTRVSKKDAPYVDYANAAVLTEQDLDAQAKQSLHIAQESIDTANNALPLATDGKWDADSKIIKNLASGVSNTDAVNVSQFITHDNTIKGYRDDTLDHRDTAESYAVKTGGVVQVFSGASNNVSDTSPTDQAGVFSAKEHAVGTTVTTGSSKDWATKPGSAQVASTDYSAKAWATHTADDIGSAKDWATKIGGQVTSADHSAKSYAMETGASAPSSGSAKEWASKDDGAVDTEFSAKAYASVTGSNAPSAGSAKEWATTTGGPVASSEHSAKAYANETGSNAPSTGSAKEWASETGAVIDDSKYSSKEYAQGTFAGTGGSSKDWATKITTQVDSVDYSSKEYAIGTSATSSRSYALKDDGAVTGTEYSSKAWAIGGTGVTGTLNSGASKEWATETSSAVDTNEYSAKEYAIGTQRRGQANGGSSKDWANYTSGTVDNTEYSAKYWALAAEQSKLAATSSASAVGSVYDNFSDRYLGTMADSDTSSSGTADGSWSAGSSTITLSNISGTIEVGQEVTGSGIPTDANIISKPTSTSIVLSDVMSSANTGSSVALTFTGQGIYGNYNTTIDGPSTDNDGNSLVTGALYFNTSDNEMRLYDGANWISVSSTTTVSIDTYKFVASGGQQTFSGTDANGATFSYSLNNIAVFLNGIKLDGSDFTATNGTSIVLGTGATLNDELVVIAFKSFTSADMVSATNGGTFAGNTTFNANLDVSSGTLITSAVQKTAIVDGGKSNLTKSDVGLGSVDNTADNAKPVSTAQQNAIDAKASLSGATFTGPITGVDVNGTELVLDADGDTSITADTDDRIDIKIGGTDVGNFNSDTLKLTKDNTPKLIVEDTNSTDFTLLGNTFWLTAPELQLNHNTGDANADGQIGNIKFQGTTKNNLGITTANNTIAQIEGRSFEASGGVGQRVTDMKSGFRFRGYDGAGTFGDLMILKGEDLQLQNGGGITIPTTSQTFTVKGIDAAIGDSQSGSAPDTTDSDSGQFAVYNGSTKLLGITEHGYVLEPETPFARVYFQSQNNAAYNNGGNKVAIPTGITINRGGHYNSSNGKFTCPVSGDYEVCFTGNYYALSSPAVGQWVRPFWSINGTEVARYYQSVKSETDVWIQICGYAVLSCSAGDYIQLNNATDSTSGGGWDLGIYSNVTFRLIG